jgi:hypothetical protein
MSKKYLVEIGVLNRLLSFFSKAKTDKSYQTALDKAFKSNNPEFNRLYNNWVKSGDKLIDGIKDSLREKGYSEEEINNIMKY